MMRALILFGTFCVTALGLLIVWASFAGYRRGVRSEGWPMAAGRVVESRVVEETTWRGTGLGWHVEKASYVRYAFEVGGTTYRSSKIDYDGMHPAFGEQLSREYPVGREVRVFYDPEAPDDAVLFPGRPSAGRSLGMALMGCCLTLIGGFGARQIIRAG